MPISLIRTEDVSVHNLKATTPLGATGPSTDEFQNLTIAEVTDRALASVSMRLGHDSEFTKRAQDLLGFDLPQPGGASIGTSFAAFWISPDSWMIDVDYDGHEDLAAQIKSVMQETASVVEQTDGWCRFDVTGAAVCDLFERLSNADIRGMESDTATRCAIHHIGCYIWCREAGQTFSVLGPRSSAGSLHHALIETAQAVA